MRKMIFYQCRANNTISYSCNTFYLCCIISRFTVSDSSTLISPDQIGESTFTDNTHLNGQLRMPEWLKAKTGKARQTAQTGALLDDLKIVTVCEEARCPNIGECWSHKT